MTALSEPIIVEQMLPAGQVRVWRAITDVNQMRQWFFPNIPDFEGRVGFFTRFDVDTGERVFPHLWTIVEVELGYRIAYDWRYGGYAGVSRLTMEVEAEGPDRTLLRIVHETLEPFDSNVPEFQPESCRVGWTYFLGRLHEYLNSGQPADEATR